MKAVQAIPQSPVRKARLVGVERGRQLPCRRRVCGKTNVWIKFVTTYIVNDRTSVVT